MPLASCGSVEAALGRGNLPPIPMRRHGAQAAVTAPIWHPALATGWFRAVGGEVALPATQRVCQAPWGQIVRHTEPRAWVACLRTCHATRRAPEGVPWACQVRTRPMGGHRKGDLHVPHFGQAWRLACVGKAHGSRTARLARWMPSVVRRGKWSWVGGEASTPRAPGTVVHRLSRLRLGRVEVSLFGE